MTEIAESEVSIRSLAYLWTSAGDYGQVLCDDCNIRREHGLTTWRCDDCYVAWRYKGGEFRYYRNPRHMEVK